MRFGLLVDGGVFRGKNFLRRIQRPTILILPLLEFIQRFHIIQSRLHRLSIVIICALMVYQPPFLAGTHRWWAEGRQAGRVFDHLAEVCTFGPAEVLIVPVLILGLGVGLFCVFGFGFPVYLGQGLCWVDLDAKGTVSGCR